MSIFIDYEANDFFLPYRSWKEFFLNKTRKVLEKGKKILNKVKKKIEKDETGVYKKIIDHAKKRAFFYLSKKIKEFQPKKKKLNKAGNSQDPTSQLTNNCKLTKSSIIVNGVEYSPKKDGHNVVAIDGKTGKVIGSKSYDTMNNAFAATTVGRDIKNLKDDTIIVIATQVC